MPEKKFHPEISIILPSLRREAALQRIKEFSETNQDSDYEIILVSPFSVKENRVVHVEEKEPLGNIIAYNFGYEYSSGDYVAWWSDDCSPTPHCLSNMLKFMRNKKPPFVGSFRKKDKLGRECLQLEIYNRLYACWGCISKESVDIMGGVFFNPDLKSNGGDVDIGVRTWFSGGKVEACQNSWVILDDIEDNVKKNNKKNNFDRDTETILNQWHPVFGQGMEKDLFVVNRRVLVYDGILSYFPSFFRPLVIKTGETIYSKLKSVPFFKKILIKIMHVLTNSVY